MSLSLLWSIEIPPTNNNMFSQYTTYLANHLCGGSSRKLIAGWWYSILGMTIAITLLSLTMISNRNSNNEYGSGSINYNVQQCIIALWSSFLLCCFSIGGTMIMRKFHNSMAVGFFMGVTVTSCQFYIALGLLYFHYRHHLSINHSNSKDVTLFACLSIIQAILLGTFAIILAAHRTEITVDNNNDNTNNDTVTELKQPLPFNNNNGAQQSQRPDDTSKEQLYPPRSSHVVRT